MKRRLLMIVLAATVMTAGCKSEVGRYQIHRLKFSHMAFDTEGKLRTDVLTESESLYLLDTTNGDLWSLSSISLSKTDTTGMARRGWIRWGTLNAKFRDFDPKNGIADDLEWFEVTAEFEKTRAKPNPHSGSDLPSGPADSTP